MRAFAFPSAIPQFLTPSLRRTAAALFVVLAHVAAAPLHADIIYAVTIDISGLPAPNPDLFEAGLDLQFNPGDPAHTQPATAFVSVNNFCCYNQFPIATGDATAGSEFPHVWDGTVFYENDTPYNDAFTILALDNTVNSQITMSIDFGGPAVDSPDPSTYTSGSSFGISLYDADNNPLLTSDPDGFLAILNLNPDGTVSTQTFPNAGGGPSSITLTDLTPPPPPPPAVPEPSTFILFSTGLAAALTCLRPHLRHKL